MDEFDHVSDDQPEGVHRAPEPWWRPLLPYLAVIILIPLLAWGAVAMLSKSGEQSTAGGGATGVQTAPAADDGSSQAVTTPAPEQATALEQTPATTAPAPPPEQTPTPDVPEGVNYESQVAVYNAAGIQGMAAAAVETIAEAGFANGSATNFDKEAPEANTVFYASPEHAAAAQEVAASLGIGNVVEDANIASSAPIAVVLVEDFR